MGLQNSLLRHKQTFKEFSISLDPIPLLLRIQPSMTLCSTDSWALTPRVSVKRDAFAACMFLSKCSFSPFFFQYPLALINRQ